MGRVVGSSRGRYEATYYPHRIFSGKSNLSMIQAALLPVARHLLRKRVTELGASSSLLFCVLGLHLAI